MPMARMMKIGCGNMVGFESEVEDEDDVDDEF